ncbi:MAG: ABC transporter ATP-binding protein [Candidatus Kariarchaeaceae archaeon]|jgi:putative ABC transport system ATP-binding protein
MSLLELKSIEMVYSATETKVHAIRGISLRINEGEFVAILGKSGSGKSTLLSLIGGLEQPTSGQILFAGNNLSAMSDDALARMRRSEVGIVFQNFFLMDVMTAFENVELPLIIAGKDKQERRKWVSELLSQVGLGDRITHFPNELSGGEKQRVGIARALANRASLIIADEPTGDLDSAKGKEIIDLLYNLNQGSDQTVSLDWKPTIIMVTHDVGMLRNGMRVLTISDGKITNDEIFDGDYKKFDRLGGPSKVMGVDYEADEFD